MKIDFLKYRYVFFAFSLIVIVGGIVFGLITGFKFDIDFKGGTKIEVDLKQEFNNHEIESIVKETVGKTALVQKMTGGTSSVTITTDVMSEEESDKVVEGLKNKYTNMDEPSVRNVQPSYGNELLNSALLALGVAVVLILLYIGIRFKTLGFTAAITDEASDNSTSALFSSLASTSPLSWKVILGQEAASSLYFLRTSISENFGWNEIIQSQFFSRTSLLMVSNR